VFTLAIGDFVVTLADGELPEIYNEYVKHARLSEQIALSEREGRLCFVAVSRDAWPFLVVAQRFSPNQDGFDHGALVVPETNVLFLGAGERLLAYDLAEPRRLWEDKADMGFLGWHRHGETVVMSAELELAAWTLSGKKLWTTFVESPWSYMVSGDRVELDVMGRRSSFDLARGPKGA
jgi:hypothetical protein